MNNTRKVIIKRRNMVQPNHVQEIQILDLYHMKTNKYNRQNTESSLSSSNSTNSLISRKSTKISPKKPSRHVRKPFSHDRWYKAERAKHNLFAVASASYALILSIFSLTYELNQLVTNESQNRQALQDVVV
uniref:Uncharacterized protein n=1 Tax=Acrobeloides nanus TaxID=290746 RepID=A0A914DWQ7_9BILA